MSGIVGLALVATVLGSWFVGAAFHVAVPLPMQLFGLFGGAGAALTRTVLAVI